MDIVIMKNHFSKRKKLEELEKQIECLYNTAHSPRTDSVWSKKNENSSPVEKALHKIEDAREEYNRLYEDWAEEHNLILDWILKIEDPKVSAIMMRRYLHGETWGQTGKFFSCAPDTCRQTIKRFIKNHPELFSETPETERHL